VMMCRVPVISVRLLLRLVTRITWSLMVAW